MLGMALLHQLNGGCGVYRVGDDATPKLLSGDYLAHSQLSVLGLLGRGMAACPDGLTVCEQMQVPPLIK